MVFSFVNRCIWTASSAGTGSFVVSAPAQFGYTPDLCLNPAVVDGASYHYFAFNPDDQTQHEEGDGVYTASSSTLTRATIRNSSTVSFSILLLSDGTSSLFLVDGVSNILLTGLSTAQKINFTSPPVVFMGGPIATDMP